MKYAIIYKLSYIRGNTIFFGCTGAQLEKIQALFDKNFEIEALEHIGYKQLSELIVQLHNYEINDNINHLYSEMLFQPHLDETKSRILCTYCNVSLKLKDIIYHVNSEQHKLKGLMKKELIAKIKEIMP